MNSGARLAARVPVAARELQARLDRFGAAVAEERARQPGQVRQPLGELALQRMVEQVRRVDQRLRLIGDRARQARMRVAERRDADARQQIEILAALGVVQTDALAAHERDRLRAGRSAARAALRAPERRRSRRRASCRCPRLHIRVAAPSRHARRASPACPAPSPARPPRAPPDRVRRRSPRRPRRSPARARRRAASRSCRPSPCRSATSRVDRRRRRDAARSRRRVEHAGRRARDDQPPRAEPRGQVPRQRVGVDVEQLRRPRRRRCWRRPARSRRASSVVEQRDVGASDRNADAAQIDRSGRRPSRCGGAASRQPAAPSAPVRPTAATPAASSAATNRVLTAPGQHRDHHVERRVVGDAQAVDLALLDARGLERRVDLLAAAVDDDERRRAPRAIARDRPRRPSPSRAGSSSSSPPNFRTSGARRVTAAPCRLVEAEHDVHVLHGLARRALQQVVDAPTRGWRGPTDPRASRCRRSSCARRA